MAHAELVDDAASARAANASAEEVGTLEGSPSFPIVGVGASAGGLEAFTQLLRALPVDTGMAFVLVQHLAPSHGSALAEILSRATSMPVTEVADEPEIEPNHVYVIPPDRNMTIVSGHLRLFQREARGRHHPIDHFFGSLARSQRHMAIGVVLSGTATDGTLGLEEIKAEGGITFAQDDTAQHDGMPQNAVASGCVDFVLSPGSIAAELERIAGHPYVTQPQGAKGDAPDASPGKQALSPILNLLRRATEVDFSQYKVNTLSRRIERRMVLLKKRELGEYAQHLRDSPAEVQALYQDILINVTSFFRDPAMFEALKEKVIPALLKNRSRYDPLRAWVLGCSTGEEAYSLAMLLTEAMDSGNGYAPAQIFATDLNATGIEKARAGVYTPERLQGVSRERLRRFFVERTGAFQVTRSIRDMCVFSRHNAMSDPPFSRMDLVSCRNVLIYLEPSLQQRIVPILHYALKPAGYLVLGASETVGLFRDLFSVEDAKHKIFAKKPGAGRLPVFPATRSQPSTSLDPQQGAQRTRPGVAARVEAAFGGGDVEKEADRLLLSFAPPAVLVDGNLDILQHRGNTEPYLVAPQGKASHALLKMAREGLLVPLRALLKRAKEENARVRTEGVQVRRGDGYEEVNLEVAPVRGRTEEGCFLVLFEEVATSGGPRKKNAGRRPKAKGKPLPPESSEANTVRLEHELASTREYLQALIEQHESANEELQSANEEAQSANEELQSINEELETSKEEIQSSNEELTTLNDELHNRNVEMAQLNSDLSNLITSVQVAIVIVGRDLRIRRVSPKAEQVLNLIASDVGRPIADIRLNIVLPELEALLIEAIDTVSSREREVQGRDARWYSLRIRPYMTLENKIDGAVLMLVDVDTLRHARDYAESVIATVRDPLLVLDAELRVRTVNSAFCASFDVTAEETQGRLVYELGNGQWDVPELRRLLGEVLPKASTIEDYVVEHEFEHIGRRVMRLNARRLVAPGEERESILLVIEDVTAFARSQGDLRHSEERYRRLFEAARDGVLILDPQSRKIIDANPFMTELLGYSREELLGKELFEIGLLKDEEASRAAFRELRAKSVLRYEDLPLESNKGERREVEMVSNLYEEDGTPVIQCNIRDISERKEHEAALRASETRLAIEADALSRLNELSSNLWRMQKLQDGVHGMLGASIELVGADFGNVQLVDARGVLVIAAQRGFRQDFVDSFREVSAEDDSACGRALRTGKRVVIEDVETDEAYAPLRPVARAAGYRAVQSTPLIGRDGRPLGMLSTHFRSKHRPSEQELRRLDLYVRQAVDFIERCRTEEELAKRNDELTEADREKNNFLAVLSHELRSPLNAIRGWVEMMKRPEASSERVRQGIEVIDRQSRAQAELISDLMDVQRLSTGKARLEISEIDLTAVLNAAVEAVVPSATEKDIRIKREIEPCPTLIFGDENRLHQVFWNLLSNAIKFTPPKGEISIALLCVGTRAEVSVRDTGEGISPGALPHLFARFRQADPSASRGHMGLGLGLAIAKQLVELHGGSIRGESAGKGRGATFTVMLPLRSAEAAVRPQALARPKAEEVPMSIGGALVLVVDDEVDAREPLREVLERAGAEVIAVGSADEATAVLREQRPSVLVSDIGMPGRDGYDLLRSIRALPRDRGGRLPAIALTAYASSADRERALRAGFDEHLAKPVDSADLVSAIAALVSQNPDLRRDRK